MQRDQRGFTLVEMLMAVAMIALVSTTAALSLPAVVQAYRLRLTTTDIVQGLREAQVQAVQSNSHWRFLLVEGSENRYYLQKSTAQAPSDECALLASGWETMRQSAPFSNSVAIQTVTHHCITFKPTGVTHWRNPQVLIDYTDISRNGELPLWRLTDGYEVSSRELSSTFSPGTADSPAVYWRRTLANPVADIVLDLQEERYVPAFCVGLISVPGYRFPSAMAVRATTQWSDDPRAWPALPNTWSMPRDPIGRQRTCIEVRPERNLRYLSIELTQTAGGTLVDEVNLHPHMILRVGSGKGNIIQVSPNTGLVSVQPVK